MKEYLGQSGPEHGPFAQFDQGVRLRRLLVETGGDPAERAFRGASSGRRFSQADKCTWWMPWHEPAMKDVASCEKPRGAASER